MVIILIIAQKFNCQNRRIDKLLRLVGDFVGLCQSKLFPRFSRNFIGIIQLIVLRFEPGIFIPQKLFLLQGPIHVFPNFPYPIEPDTDEIETDNNDGYEKQIVPAHLPKPAEQTGAALPTRPAALLPAHRRPILLGLHPITLSEK